MIKPEGTGGQSVNNKGSITATSWVQNAFTKREQADCAPKMRNAYWAILEK